MNPSIKRLVLAAAAHALFFAAAAASAQVNTHNIKLGYGVPEEHPIGQGVNKFVELVAQKSGGKIRINKFPNSVLGGDMQMVSAAQGGVQELVAVSSAPLVGLVREFAIFDFPFLFADEREADAVLEGHVGRKLLDMLSDKGLVGLCYFENGFRNVTNSKRPITKLEDISGLKLRVIQSPVYLETFSTLGANAVPMPFPEVFGALESKAIDGQENPYANIYNSRYYEVQKYLSVTKHAYAPLPVLASKKFWDKLSADEKNVFQAACTEARQYQIKTNREQGARLLAELKAKGMAVNEIAPAEMARMREKVKPVVDKYAKQVGEDLLRETTAEIAKAKK
jgi:tripartite ATP-independent transporter DctP family solute receptor